MAWVVLVVGGLFEVVWAYARARRWIEGTLAVVFAGAGLKLLTVR